jgi:acyl carrier protein
MSIESQVDQILLNAIHEINEQLPPNHKMKADKSTLLFGKDGVLDSLTLVNLIVTVEQKLQESMNATITLADERAMSQKNSPFKSVESFANYIVMLLKEQSN